MRRTDFSKTKCENAVYKLGLHDGEASLLKSIDAEIVQINDLREHEKIDKEYCEQLKRRIQKDGLLKRAIAVDINTRIVLDGHHRLNALRKLGCKKIPVVFIDYNNPIIRVQAWKEDTVSKQIVIEAGTSPNKLPPKTTRHTIVINGSSKHISCIEKIVNIPLSELKPKNNNVPFTKSAMK